jgi:hypothetical protein
MIFTPVYTVDIVQPQVSMKISISQHNEKQEYAKQLKTSIKWIQCSIKREHKYIII